MKKFLLAAVLVLFCAVNVMAKDIYVNILLDETGSMTPNRESTVTAFNDFLAKQKDKNADIYLSLWMFNDGTGVRTVYEQVNIKKIEKLTYDQYNPNNNTPLFDAIGKTVGIVDVILKKNEVICSKCLQSIKPGVLYVVMTDGMENASREFNLERVQELLKEKKYQGWETMYIGDNVEQKKQGDAMFFSTSGAISATNCSGRMKSVECSLDRMILPANLPTISGTVK